MRRISLSRIDLDWLIETRGRTLTMGPRRRLPFGNAGLAKRTSAGVRSELWNDEIFDSLLRGCN